MSLSGQLNDLSLGELIEFFCNQRKTGRLKVDYALAPGVFFIKEGHLVDAKVGGLNGVEAIYFALTLPSASFDFSAGVLSSRATIQEPWARVVLEGLRRIDEGVAPASDDAFLSEDAPDEASLDYLNCVEEAQAATAAAAEKPAAEKPAAEPAKGKEIFAGITGEEINQEIDSAFAEVSPLSLTVEAAAGVGRGGRGKMFAAGAALVLICAVVAVPVSRRLMRPKTEQPAAVSPAPPAAEVPAAAAADNVPAGETPAPEVVPTPDAAAAAAEETARREQREREQRDRARRQREEAARRAEDAGAAEPAAAKPETKAAAGPKTVRVQITYDEAGRVTQAASVGASAGAEAYASAAVRAARGRRFPAGKAGTTVVTIPVN
jgi:hypothetical protein